MKQKLAILKLTILVGFFAAASAFATSGTWTGTGADNLFVNATNWSASPAPTNSGDVVTFDGTGDNAKAAAISIDAVIGGPSSGGGSSLALLSGQTSAVGLANTYALTNAGNLNPNTFWRLNTNGISVAAGAGPLTFSTTISNFCLLLGGNPTGTIYPIINSNAPGVNPITFGPGVYFDRGAGIRTLGIDGPGDVIISGKILCNVAGNSIRLAKSGTGTLTLSGDSTDPTGFSSYPLRGVTLNAGTLNINNAGALGTNDPVNGGTFMINGGTIGNTSGNDIAIKLPVPQIWIGDFTFAGTNSLDLSNGAVTLSANRQISLSANRQVTVSANTLTVGGVISGAGFSLTKAGSGKLVLSGANTYSGNTTVSAGTLEIAQAYLATNSTVAISNGAVLQLDFATTNQVSALVLNGVAQTNGIYGSSTPGGYLAGAGYLQVELNTNGIVNTGLAGAWTGSGADNLFVNPLNWSAFPAPTNTGDVAVFDGSGDNVKAAGGISISTSIGGSSAGSGSSLALLAGQTSAVLFTSYSNPYWRLNTNGISVAAGAGPLTFNPLVGKLNLLLGGNPNFNIYTISNNNASGVNPITFGPSVYFDRGAGLRTLSIGGPGDVIINGKILSGSTGTSGIKLAKSGTGTLTLAGDSTDPTGYSSYPLRSVTLNAGTLNINNAGALGTNDLVNGSMFTINGGTIDNTSGADITIKLPVPQAWNGDFTYAGTYGLNLSNGAVTLSTNRQVTVSANTLTVGGVISGPGFSLTKAGSGTLVLSGANTYSGNTTVSAGTLEIAQAYLATNSTVAISNGAVLQLDFATTNQVSALVLNGVAKANGVYGSSTPGGYLAGAGYLQVASVGPTGPAHLTNSVIGNQLSMSWPSGQGWKLQMQTNSLSTGLGTNWTYITDGSVTSTNITIVPTLPTVFFRLVYP